MKIILIGMPASGNLNILKYLLTSGDLNEHANIHAKKDEYFKEDCKENYLKIIKFFIRHEYKKDISLEII